MNPIPRSMVLPAISTAVVAASVIAAIVMLGGPSVQRKHKMDGVRVQNLTIIALSVNGYFTRHKKLPADLDSLAKEPGYHISRLILKQAKPTDTRFLAPPHIVYARILTLIQLTIRPNSIMHM